MWIHLSTGHLSLCLCASLLRRAIRELGPGRHAPSHKWKTGPEPTTSNEEGVQPGVWTQRAHVRSPLSNCRTTQDGNLAPRHILVVLKQENYKTRQKRVRAREPRCASNSSSSLNCKDATTLTTTYFYNAVIRMTEEKTGRGQGGMIKNIRNLVNVGFRYRISAMASKWICIQFL